MPCVVLLLHAWHFGVETLRSGLSGAVLPNSCVSFEPLVAHRHGCVWGDWQAFQLRRKVWVDSDEKEDRRSARGCGHAQQDATVDGITQGLNNVSAEHWADGAQRASWSFHPTVHSCKRQASPKSGGCPDFRAHGSFLSCLITKNLHKSVSYLWGRQKWNPY